MKLILRKEAGDGWTFEAIMAFGETLRRLLFHALSPEKAAKIAIEIQGAE